MDDPIDTRPEDALRPGDALSLESEVVSPDRLKQIRLRVTPNGGVPTVGKAHFDGATFFHDADFSSWVFESAAFFDRATFKGTAVFDRATVVAGRRHLKDVKKFIPRWWGITAAMEGQRGAIHFETVRRAALNPSADDFAVAQLLWRNEAEEEPVD